MMPAGQLRAVPLLQGLAEERFDWLSLHADEVVLAPGDVLLRQGEKGCGFFIILDGDLLLLHEQGAQETIAGRRAAPSFLGEISTLTGYPITVTCRAQTACRLVRLREPVFFELLGCCPVFARTIFRSMVDRTTETENIVRDLEKMASLGTLAAGLAHELNNPAAAAVRALDRARRRADSLTQPAADAEMAAFLDAIAAHRDIAPVSALDTAEAEERLADWLAEHGIADAFDLAPILAAAGVGPQDLAPLARAGDADAFVGRVNRLAGSLDLEALLGEAANACRRISALVGAVKSYSYMDRDARQEVDIHRGIEDTLTILKHRWPAGIAIVRRFNAALPSVTAYGSELNQVWTNLLINALDAVGKSGTITVATRREGGYVVVSIADDGPGIPDAIRSRIFDPFFTTKPAGQGTGLGLDIAQRIVVARHCGTIAVTSRPGDTRFDVAIPIIPPDAKTS
jgi:signal transduction histidine kinase